MARAGRIFSGPCGVKEHGARPEVGTVPIALPHYSLQLRTKDWTANGGSLLCVLQT